MVGASMASATAKQDGTDTVVRDSYHVCETARVRGIASRVDVTVSRVSKAVTVPVAPDVPRTVVGTARRAHLESVSV